MVLTNLLSHFQNFKFEAPRLHPEHNITTLTEAIESNRSINVRDNGTWSER